jgi:hypothetical protein
MTRFIQAEFATAEHAGITRMTRGFSALGNTHTANALVSVLAFIGRPVVKAAGKVSAVVSGWSTARKQRADDDKLWALALGDARVMADLSRAMSAEASRSGRGYY